MQILAWLCGLSLAADLARQSRQTLSRYLKGDAMTELKDNNFVYWISLLVKTLITVPNELGNGSTGYGL